MSTKALTDAELRAQLLDELAAEARMLAAWDLLQEAAELLRWELTFPGGNCEPDYTTRYILLSTPAATVDIMEKLGPEHMTVGPYEEAPE